MKNENFWLMIVFLGFIGMAWAWGAKKDYWGWFFLPVFIASVAMSILGH